ncbi:hypothetical protein GGR21_002142 [Dysgonomonas hofstadii]|uniref:Uncharacterized protein n=1 Tax=Dysgonomonas hofstadii TaxID=637886 RepID=A0A840CMA8_9BACT|nr:hypothetical protein [Dysgonomonas hofstadii]MBB4036241.1 hypothetical protein [Dysgonomonas hofstadii]
MKILRNNPETVKKKELGKLLNKRFCEIMGIEEKELYKIRL